MNESVVPLIDYGPQIRSVAKFQKPFFCCVAFIIILFICLMFQVYLGEYNTTIATILLTNGEDEVDLNETLDNSYLVNSIKCKIPNLNPFNIEAKQFYKSRKYMPCSKLGLLSYITRNDNTATLHIDSEMAPSYSNNKTICCYSNITRQREKDNPDDHIKISKCTDFHESVQVSQEYVMIKCRSGKSKKTIYENTHATIPIKASVKERSQNFSKNSTKPYSVLILGIDSISRLNLIRTLPTTHQFLEDNQWISLNGYNKMGDNTFPNLMAILTGYNQSEAYRLCIPTRVGRLNSCPFIWKDYQQLGYATAYAEDEASINTFNYKKKGFDQQPTDYYFRPLILASEKMKTVKYDSLTYCVGPETYGEKIMNLARDFANTLKEYPFWGFFWMNTFSHNDVNEPGVMNAKIRTVLRDLSENDSDSIVVFLSDHGIRFGEIRYTHTGWLEERLPFVYISVPKRFQKQYPREYSNLKRNAYRLTTPYDLHMTLQHVLELSGLNHTLRPSTGCPNCTSLFKDVGDERGCNDVGISPHWCSCYGYSTNGLNQTIVDNAKRFLLGQLQNLTAGHNRCAVYGVRKVRSASVSEPSISHAKLYVLIVVETVPKAFFEATVSYDVQGANSSPVMQLQGSISRLDSYASHSNCIGDEYLKKYCYCQ